MEILNTSWKCLECLEILSVEDIEPEHCCPNCQNTSFKVHIEYIDINEL